MKLTKNIIALKKGFIYIPDSEERIFDNGLLVNTVQAELMQLGFMFSKKAYKELKWYSEDFIISYYNEIIPYLKQSIGASKNYCPFYVNFPTQVMDMSIEELFINAILHYWSDGEIEPLQELKERGLAFEHTEYKT